MKIGEGTFNIPPQTLYMPKAAVTALDLKDGDTVEFHVDDGDIIIRKTKK